MEFGIVINTRKDSTRIKHKPLQLVNGVTLIEHLVKRLLLSKIPIVIACPMDDARDFDFLRIKYPNLEFLYGDTDDPLSRMKRAAVKLNIKNVIRITHDKVFVSNDHLAEAIVKHASGDHDYTYSDSFIDGSAFEIISTDVLIAASEKHTNVEHISYAARAFAKKPFCFSPSYGPGERKSLKNLRLLVDYPCDLELMSLLMAILGNDCKLQDVIHYSRSNPWLMNLNKAPDATIYTCVYNGDKFLKETIDSVVGCTAFNNSEYIIVDDASTDRTPEICAQYLGRYGNIRYIRNGKNIGLAASSNVALSHARGRFITRLDADDYYCHSMSLANLLVFAQMRNSDAVYPAFHDGSSSRIGDPKKNHHSGGALFNTRALNYLRYTDELRGYDSLDLYLRARDVLKITYYQAPVFFYRHRVDSMSKTNIEEREKIKDLLTRKYVSAQIS